MSLSVRLNDGLIVNPHALLYKAKKIITPMLKTITGIAVAAITNSQSQQKISFSAITGYGICVLLIANGLNGLYNYYSNSTPAERMPVEFYEELAKKNKEKPRGAPLALFELAEYDHSGALSGPADHLVISQIANTYRLAIRTVGKPSDIRQTIHEVGQNHGQIQSLFISAHGNPTSMQLSKTSDYTESEDHASIFQEMAGKTIYLLSCSVGESIARTISEKAKTHLWAPMTTAYSSTQTFYPCRTHELDMNFYLVDKHEEWPDVAGRQDVRIFHPDGTLTIPCTSPSESFNEIIAYYEKKVLAGGRNAPKAMFDLGHIYLNCKHIKDSEQKAERYFERLHKLGYKEASYELGRIYCNSVFKKNIGLRLIESAAAARHPDALYYLGDYFEKKNDMVQATPYFLIAAKLNHAAAAFRVGLILKAKQDLCKAETFFIKAVNQDLEHAHACYELGLIWKDSYPDQAKELFTDFNSRFKAIYFKDHAPSQFEMGCILEKKGNFKDAVLCFEKAANQKWEKQAEAKAHMVENYKHLVESLEPKAREGNVAAQLELGKLYEKLEDKKQARYWYLVIVNTGVLSEQSREATEALKRFKTLFDKFIDLFP